MDELVNVGYIDENKKTKNCPAVIFRKHVEKNLEGKKPKMVVLSEECMDFFVNECGASKRGYAEKDPNIYENDFCFFWDKDEEYPALLMKIKVDKDSKEFILTYFKEEADKERGIPGFLWDINDKNNTEDPIILYYPSDTAEDIIDMDISQK